MRHCSTDHVQPIAWHGLTLQSFSKKKHFVAVMLGIEDLRPKQGGKPDDFVNFFLSLNEMWKKLIASGKLSMLVEATNPFKTPSLKCSVFKRPYEIFSKNNNKMILMGTLLQIFPPLWYFESKNPIQYTIKKKKTLRKNQHGIFSIFHLSNDYLNEKNANHDASRSIFIFF